jgi:hypothetical protein
MFVPQRKTPPVGETSGALCGTLARRTEVLPPPRDAVGMGKCPARIQSLIYSVY